MKLGKGRGNGNGNGNGLRENKKQGGRVRLGVLKALKQAAWPSPKGRTEQVKNHSPPTCWIREGPRFLLGFCRVPVPFRLLWKIGVTIPSLYGLCSSCPGRCLVQSAACLFLCFLLGSSITQLSQQGGGTTLDHLLVTSRLIIKGRFWS